MTRTVLITGGAGFIGSNLARALAEGGDRVRILDDLSIGRTAYLEGVPHALVVGSLADPATVRSAVDGVDAVVHLAARAGIDDSVRDPLGTFEANVAWSIGVLDAARLAGVRRFVFASSNAAAGDHPPPSDETDLPHPLSPYGASKLAIEGYVGAYAATYGLVGCSLRFSNAYGPRSLHKRSVVAAWLRAALDGEPIVDPRRWSADPRLHPCRRPRGGRRRGARRTRGGRGRRAVPGRDRGRDDRGRAGGRDRLGRSGGRSTSVMGRPGSVTWHATSRGSTRPPRSSASGRGSGSPRASPGRLPGSHAPWPTPSWPRSGDTPRRARSEPRRPMTATAPAPDVAPLDTPIARPVRPGASPLMRDALVTIVTRFGLAVLIFATDIVLARLLGPAAKGRFALVLLYSQLAALIVGWGTDQALAVVSGRDRETARHGFANAIIWTAVVGGAAVLASVWLFGAPGEGPADGPLATLIPNLSGTQFMFAAVAVPGRALLRARALRAARAEAGRPLQLDPRLPSRDPAGHGHRRRGDRPAQPRRRPDPQSHRAGHVRRGDPVGGGR